MDELDEELLEKVDGGIIRYTKLAKKLGAPLSTVHFRVRRLEKEGVIKYYKGEIDWKKAGFSITAFIFINIDVNLLKKLGKTQDRLLRELMGVLYVREGHVITGDADLFVKIIARDSGHLKELLLNYIDAKEGIVKTKTMIALD